MRRMGGVTAGCGFVQDSAMMSQDPKCFVILGLDPRIQLGEDGFPIKSGMSAPLKALR
jgi:hypothetical protein